MNVEEKRRCPVMRRLMPAFVTATAFALLTPRVEGISRICGKQSYWEIVSMPGPSVKSKPDNKSHMLNAGPSLSIDMKEIIECDKWIIVGELAIEKEPMNPSHYVTTAKYYYRKWKYTGDYTYVKRAVKYYSKAIELNSENAEYYILRAIAYEESGLYDKAIEDCKKALHLDPENLEYGIYFLYLINKVEKKTNLRTDQ